MRAPIIAALIFITLALALSPWLIMASDAMSACQLTHSYDTCVNTLR